ncbi:MAG TPA: biotin--[acetyl-CoA-carboxylase] ligase [Ktedonobacterales bacterium]
MHDDDDNAPPSGEQHGELVAAPLDVEAVQAEIVPLRLGHPFLYFPAIGSTNTYAAELAREGAVEGMLVTTDDQTTGRGRIGRVWRSLPGQQLAVSLVLRPAFPPHFLVMASALAVAEAIEEVAGLRLRSYRDAHEHGGVAVPRMAPEAATATAGAEAEQSSEVGIKWPNDVRVAGRKVCGILIETSEGFAVLGIGINVNGTLSADAELAAQATTLAEAAGRPIAREALLVALLRRLDALYAELQMGGEAAREDVRARWRARLETLGHPVRIQQGEQAVEGVAEDVNGDGALLLRESGGALRTVTWGDVSA